MRLMVIIPQYTQAEGELRRRPFLAAASAGTQIEFSEIKGDVFKLMIGPGAAQILSMLGGPQVVEKAREAQEKGFDAVLPYGTLDFGVDAACCQVDIPVVAEGRTSFCLAASLATRIGVIVYHSKGIPNTRKFIREIGLDHFVTSVRAVEMLQFEMTAQRQLLKERFIELGKRAIKEEDAEIILPKGISMVPVYLSAQEMSKEIGVPVIDCVAVQVKTAEMLVSMGIRNSRKAYPAA